MPAAGIIYKTGDGKVLLLHRAKTEDYPGHWGLPGGHLEGDESPWDAARRESVEETGIDPPLGGVMGSGTTEQGFTIFLVIAPGPMEVTLNHEHDDYGWFGPGEHPWPLMPGLEL